ncbi:MAG: LPS-assembly protein LptD [Pseudomonadota bacterium]
MPSLRPTGRLSGASGILMLAALLSITALADKAEDSRPCAEPASTPASGPQAEPLLDWTGILETGRTALRSQRCGGSYLDPLRDLDTSQDPALANIEAEAPRSELQGDIVRFFGGLEARQGYRRIRAAEAEYDQSTGMASLLGNVEVREPGVLLRGATGTVDTVNDEARLTANQFVLHNNHLRGGADLVVRRGDGIIELDDGYYTYCPPRNEDWLLQAGEIELDPKAGVGTARDAKITLSGVPIFYTPWIQFPLDDRRKSGFLFPEITDDSNGGLDLAAPYYFNLAPNMDATLTPRLITDRGLLTELEFRYLSENLGAWTLGGAYIGGDEQYQLDVPGEDGDRWLATADQRGLFNQRWRSRIDFTRASDDEYFNDIGTTTLQQKQSTHLLQRGEIDYLGDAWQASLRLESFQTIARDVLRDPYSKLPQLLLTRTAPQQTFAPNLIWQSDYAYFDHDELATGHRLYNEVGVSYPMEWIWGFLKPTAKYRQLNYQLDEDILIDGELVDTPDVGAPMFSLDGGLFFERETRWGMQTLEPRLFYLYSEREDQDGLPNFDSNELTFTYNQLYRDTRFSGNDRIDDSNQITVGVTTRLLDQDSGAQTLSASLGQIFYFDDRLVTLNGVQQEDLEGSSAIAAELELALDANWGFRSAWLWNTDDGELDQSTLQLGWEGDSGALVNLGYSFRRNRSTLNNGIDIDQVDLSAYWPINREWRVFVRSLYDLEAEDRLNDMLGIEYNSCCYRLRLVYQRYIDQATNRNSPELVEYENATYLEFQLKGLGGLGTRVSELLEEFIRGYSDSDL